MLKTMPEHVRVLELAGVAEFGLKQYVQTEAFLAKVVKVSPGLLRARHMLAQTYLRSNQPHKVVEVLRPVLESQQVDGATLSMAGEAWLQMGEGKKAEAAFQAAAKVAPDDPEVRTAVALSQLARGQAGAMADLEKIAAQDRGLRADLALVSALLAKNELAGALKAIDGVERKLPEQPVAHNLRGHVLLLKGDFPAAAKAFEAALAKDATFYPAIASLAAIDLNNGKPDAARKRFEDLSAAQPRNPLPLLALAELSARMGGSQADVLKFMQAAVKANPGEAAPHLALVQQLLGLGEGKQAMAAAQAATAALPLDLELMQALSRAQMAAGDSHQAVATAKKLAALQPSNAMHQVLLADAHLAARDNTAAAQALRQALQIKPDLLQAQAAQVRLALLEKASARRPGAGAGDAKERTQAGSGLRAGRPDRGQPQRLGRRRGRLPPGAAARRSARDRDRAGWRAAPRRQDCRGRAHCGRLAARQPQGQQLPLLPR